jgi:Na+/H+ antiporter NhaD/arsenite permease-like protein
VRIMGCFMEVSVLTGYRRSTLQRLALTVTAFAIPAAAGAESRGKASTGSLVGSGIGWAVLAIFIVAYVLVIAEERLRLRKSVPVLVAAGVIWILVAMGAERVGGPAIVQQAVRHNLLEFGELFLFLLSAITYVNTLEERQVFDALRSWLVARRFSLRSLFWTTGALAFAISPVADNLTTTLIMGAVAISVSGGNARFVTVACINIVVAANAGGAFSPFGDITTLMVWQKGMLPFAGFLPLLVPALVNWLVPAVLMSLTVPSERPATAEARTPLRRGALVVVALFLGTIVMTVALHSLLSLPPALGMMTGLGALKVYGYWCQRAAEKAAALDEEREILAEFEHKPDPQDPFDVFKLLQRVEWDTMMFFYGVMLCVGGLATAGYLAITADLMYGHLDPTLANTIVGILSALVDNIPVMFAVLTMHPEMSQAQWQLVTFTVGVGGSLLSIGSAAGVALMGQAHGIYTFRSHLKWSWAVALGYAASIATHWLISIR